MFLLREPVIAMPSQPWLPTATHNHACHLRAGPSLTHNHAITIKRAGRFCVHAMVQSHAFIAMVANYHTKDQMQFQ